VPALEESVHFRCARQLCRSTDLPTTMLCPSSSHQSLYDECRSAENRKKALPAIARVARPREDPVYGKDGPLVRV
jgi:uncharacterized protein YjlB